MSRANLRRWTGAGMPLKGQLRSARPNGSATSVVLSTDSAQLFKGIQCDHEEATEMPG
jgi:hypothetical protein